MDEKNNNIEDKCALFIRKMKDRGIDDAVIDTFLYYYKKLLLGDKGYVPENETDPIVPDEFADAGELKTFAEGEAALSKSVIIKLNGGLAAGMGMTYPKSLCKVKNGLRFIDIFLGQAQRFRDRMKTPPVLMNSFRTNKPTIEAIRNLDQPPLTFVQNMFPKVLQSDPTPAVWKKNPDLEWNPPGHGDIYAALNTSGMLEKLLNMGIHYAFISNSDNLGAVMDVFILGYFALNGFPIMMELAPAICQMLEAASCSGAKTEG